jgi:hypothetical protein
LFSNITPPRIRQARLPAAASKRARRTKAAVGAIRGAPRPRRTGRNDVWRQMCQSAAKRAGISVERVIMEVHRHLVAIIDHVIHDTFDSGGAGAEGVAATYGGGQ